MTAEVGHFALILGLVFAALQMLLPGLGAFTGNRLWLGSARPLVAGQFVFVAISFVVLVMLFLQDDFTVRYVAANSNTLLPDRYKVSAVWGAHEGSLLLWVLILALWTLAVTVFSRSLPLALVARVLAVMGAISVGFYLFLLLTSNPFSRTLPYPPVEGADLNPLLQDFGLIVHPPMLYMGYVGFSVAFAFAIAALWQGRIDAAWACWTRPWTNIAWMFLTIGIALGSWWAYYELGWGGWWFWDPVENASFMPWLAGTALIHSLAVTEKRGVFRSWTLLLAIFAFSLSLLGTFLVRSGVLTSVHAFAVDPERGIFILLFLGVVICGSLTLFALRGPVLKGVASFGGLSRELFLLLNNILLMVATATILLGTLYPLIAAVMEWGRLSVGPPYFNFFFVPIVVALALLVAVAALLRWKRTRVAGLLSQLSLPFLASLGLALVVPLLLSDSYSWGAALTIGLGCWIASAICSDIHHKLRHKKSRLAGPVNLPGSYWGMHLAHLGLAVCIVGAGLTSIYSEERDIRLEPGDQATVSGYQFRFASLNKVRGKNYIADQATITLSRGDKQLAQLYPEKRRYLAGGQVMTEAAIDPGLWRDVYVSLGEPLTGEAWAVRVYIKPLVRWIWLGALMIGLGGLVAALDKRYRRNRLAERGAKVVGVVA